MIGVGNGGAIAAVLDLLTASLATIYAQAATPTASLQVRGFLFGRLRQRAPFSVWRNVDPI